MPECAGTSLKPGCGNYQPGGPIEVFLEWPERDVLGRINVHNNPTLAASRDACPLWDQTTQRAQFATEQTKRIFGSVRRPVE
jgi:hypothetical protein